MTDSTGALLGINRYDEFGKPGASNIGRFQYTGQAWFAEDGIQYSKARMYHPGLGRFMQTDPIGYEGGANLYAYVGNDPVNFTDPFGLRGNITINMPSDDLLDEIVIEGHRPDSGCMACATPGLSSAAINDLAGMMGSQPSVGSEPIVVTGQRPIVITGRPASTLAASLFTRAANNRYYGPSFCSNPTWGGRNLHFPLGRINSGKAGDAFTAIEDLDRIATANGIPPLGSVITSGKWVQLSHASPFPFPLGDGWWAHKNYVTGYTSVSNRALTLRFNSENIRIDIPRGMMLS